MRREKITPQRILEGFIANLTGLPVSAYTTTEDGKISDFTFLVQDVDKASQLQKAIVCFQQAGIACKGNKEAAGGRNEVSISLETPALSPLILAALARAYSGRYQAFSEKIGTVTAIA